LQIIFFINYSEIYNLLLFYNLKKLKYVEKGKNGDQINYYFRRKLYFKKETRQRSLWKNLFGNIKEYKEESSDKD